MHKDEARFWSKVEKTDGCHFWRGYVSRKTGYGVFYFEDHRTQAHRYAYILRYGTLDPRARLISTCHHTDCVNAEHWHESDVAERVGRYIDKGGPNGCWIWNGSCKPNGYGQISIGGSSRLARRVVWELVNGPIIEGRNLVQNGPCEDPLRCVNPAHHQPAQERTSTERRRIAALARSYGHPRTR